MKKYKLIFLLFFMCITIMFFLNNKVYANNTDVMVEKI